MTWSRLFGGFGTAWAILAPILLVVWFSFADSPWSIPFGDWTNPIQLMIAAILYGLPVIMTAIYFMKIHPLRDGHAQD